MRRRRWIGPIFVLVLFVLPLSACGGGTPRTGPTSTTTTTTPSTSTTSTTTEPLTALATVTPDQGVAGTALTFSVEIRGPGTLGGEGVTFGDGAASGANAGDVSCGATARADRTSTYTHAYTQPGTYQFRDEVTVQAHPPSCAFEHATARATVIVAAPLADATLNGAFASPSKNIACSIDAAPPGSVRCATFAPPQLVTMDASGAITTCSGTSCELGNPDMETPVLPYGSATAGGPFQCLSTEAGMICTIVGHKGFKLSRASIQPLG